MTSEVPPIETRVGHTGIAELRFWGRPVFGELLGRTTATQMLVCGIIGRILDENDIAIVDAIQTAMSSADPRLWPFKITRLAAAYGSAPYALGATFVASEGAIFGVNRFQAIAEALESLASRELSDDGLREVLEQGTVGFGILYGRYDARFDALVGEVTKRQRHERAYMRLALRAVRIARRDLKTEPHVFVAIAALCLDMGMSPYEVGVFGMLPLFHDALANAAEGARQRPPQLQSLPTSAIKYVGHPARFSPKAQEDRT